MQYRVISTDDHIVEPPGTFVDRLPAALKDKAPRIVKGTDGGDGWTWDGTPPRMTFGLNAVAGRAFQDYKVSGLTWDEILPGNYDGPAHLKDMDIDGVDAAVIYPMTSISSISVPDRELGLACLRAYNDWLLEEFCAADPERLVNVCLLPLDDGMDATLAEFQRVIKRGAKSFFLPYFPATPYYDAYWDPLWQVASEAGTPVTMHRTMGGKEPASGNTPSPLAAPGLNIAGIVERFFSAVAPLTRMIYTGVFERFPALKFVDAEVNCGWVPFWVQMMEQEYERQRHWSHPPITKSPKEFVGTNVFVTVLDDYVGFELAKHDQTVADAAMFSSDYPHSTTLWPNSQKYIAELTTGMAEATKEKLLSGNAMRAFSLTA